MTIPQKGRPRKGRLFSLRSAAVPYMERRVKSFLSPSLTGKVDTGLSKNMVFVV